MRFQVIAILVGLGVGGVFWLVWDYIGHLRRRIAWLEQENRELHARNDEMVVALGERADAARIDEAIRKGRAKE